jgi:hypothetical protein
MPIVSRWERWEFEQLLRSPALSHEELAALNGHRAPAAIAAMRLAVHGYHARDAARARRLTHVQAALVDAYRGQQVCAICGVGW